MTGYEAAYHSQRHSNYFDEKYFRARAEIAKEVYFRGVPDGARVLEYGCGFGQNIALLPEAIGYDISAFALAQCRARGIQVTGDLEDIADTSMDVVFSAHVLEHHPEPLRMLREMRAKLRAGGMLILVLPHERHGRASFGPDLDQHLYTWNFRTINNLLAKAGFQVESNRYSRGWGYSKALVCRRFGLRFYRMVTTLIAFFMGRKELVIVARL